MQYAKFRFRHDFNAWFQIAYYPLLIATENSIKELENYSNPSR